MMRKQIVAMLMGAVLFGSVQAQEKLTLDLEAARQYALDYNRTIKNSGLAIEQSQEKLWETIAAGLPQVNATADYSNAMGAEISIQFDETQEPSKIPIKPTSNFNLQVGQLLFNGSYLVGIQTAKLAQKLSEKNFEKTEQDVLSQVTESYYLVLIAEESMKILESNVKNLNEVYRKTEPLVRVGMMEKVELDQLSVQVNSLNNSVRAAERQHEMAKNLMRVQLGVSADTELELTRSLADFLDDNTLVGTESSFVPGQNLDFQLLEVQEEMTEKQILMQQANYLPTITGYYNYTEKILKPAFDMSPRHMIGLQMNIPIFSSGERRAKVRQARIDLETTRNTKALMQDQLDIQFKQLQFNLKSAIESYQVQKKNVEVSREVYQNLKRKYGQGMISGLELTTADNNYLQSESEYLASMLEVLQAQNALDTLTGKLVNN
ncbi:Outer membrane protein TolC [Mariniphaga anaerophila]|uniref:Outer membrane protein TolC n=1 Tax=Mariniphaga anaerophila TaxID=1484053 RepID=A0A1M4YGW3_9BACT|nr:TolC family protein [Mariniphaga anaerophila]SHF04918.1 Outer membrane protein TolC [Mariniphaga anaerophila]